MSQGYGGSDPVGGVGADMLMTERPSWPKVVGIISIVWASLGVTCSGCGIAGLAMQSTFMNMAGQGGGGAGGTTIPPVPDVMNATTADFASAALGSIPGILLLIGGIMLVNRKPAARGLHLTYAVVGLILSIVGTMVAWQKQQAISAWAAQNTDNFWAQQQTQSGPMTLAAIGFGVLLGMAWPVFCLIWFGLIKRRAGDMGSPAFEAAA